MNLQHLKIVLKVLSQELFNENLVPKNDKDDLEELPDKLLSYGVDTEVFKNGFDYIIDKFDKNNLKEGTVNNLIYQEVKIIFLNTTQLERFHHLTDILQDFYNNLLQKLIELKKLESIISIEEFNQIVEDVTPFVKLTLLNKLLKTKDSEAIKIAIIEIIEVISNRKFSREVCYEIIKNKLNDKEIERYKFVNYTVISNNNVGRLGEYFKLIINLEENEKRVAHYFFIKCLLAVGDSIRLELSNISFRKEEIFYSDIVRYLLDFGYSEVVDFAPRCYFSRQYQYIVFDDVSLKNYSNISNKLPLTYNQLSESFKQLAKLHSIGIIFEDVFSKLLGKTVRLDTYYKDMIVECFADATGVGNVLITTGIKAGKYLIERFNDICVSCSIEEFKEKYEDASNTIYNVTKPSEHRRNFFGHGDVWVNNFLYQTSSISCLIVDYQLTRYCNPSFDVLSFLNINTDKETRLKYGNKLIDEYYLNLKSIFDKYNINIDSILSKTDFVQSFEEVNPSVVSLALFYMPLIFLPEEVFKDPVSSMEIMGGDRAKFVEMYWHKLDISRFRELVEDLYEILK